MSYVEATRDFVIPVPPAAVFAALPGALAAARLNVLHVSPEAWIVQARAGWSWWSFGENVTAAVMSGQGSTTVLRMHSRLRMVTNLFAGYRHEQHFRAVLDALRRSLGG